MSPTASSAAGHPTSPIHWRGSVDIERVPGLRRELLEHIGRSPHVTLDLSAVEHLDTAGAALLVEALQQTRALGTTLRLTGVGDRTREILRATRLDVLFELDR